MATGVVVTIGRGLDKPPLGEFSYPYGWSNSHAAPSAVVCQMLTTNPNPHDIRVAESKFGRQSLNEALAALDAAQRWPSKAAEIAAKRNVAAFAPQG